MNFTKLSLYMKLYTTFMMKVAFIINWASQAYSLQEN
jgi:hypothetical protein